MTETENTDRPMSFDFIISDVCLFTISRQHVSLVRATIRRVSGETFHIQNETKHGSKKERRLHNRRCLFTISRQYVSFGSAEAMFVEKFE